MTNSCGSCKHFQKVGYWQSRGGGGLCQLNDVRTRSDYPGKDCKGYKRIKIHRADIAQ
jgi:hypothetical protein